MTNIEHFEAELLDLLKKYDVPVCVCVFPANDTDLRIIGGALPYRLKDLRDLYAVIKPAMDAELARRLKERGK